MFAKQDKKGTESIIIRRKKYTFCLFLFNHKKRHHCNLKVFTCSFSKKKQQKTTNKQTKKRCFFKEFPSYEGIPFFFKNSYTRKEKKKYLCWSDFRITFLHTKSFLKRDLLYTNSE